MISAKGNASKLVTILSNNSGLVGQGIKDFVTENNNQNQKPGETWVFLSSKDGDLTDRKSTEAIFEKHKPTHVIHLAAKVGGLFANMAEKVEFYRSSAIASHGSPSCKRWC